jgi:beta-mannanase
VPSQSAVLFRCETPLSGKVLDYSKECHRFEDYYPGDKYVDIV